MNRSLLVTAALLTGMPMLGCSGPDSPGAGATTLMMVPLDAGALVQPPPPLFPPSAGPASSAPPVGPPGAPPPVPGQPPAPAPPPVVVPPAACSFDTHAVLFFQGRVIESITGRGRLFNFEANGTPWSSNGMDLTQVPHFAIGPCAGRAPGQCTFDTRTFALFGGRRLVEFVTANGRSWAFENGSPTDFGTDLATVPRYADVCSLRNGGPCTFNTRTFVNVDGELIESITAYGRYFSYDARGGRSAENGLDLTQVARYAAGPCRGRAFGQCTFDTRTYGVVEGRTAEIVTAYGLAWRYLPDHGFAEVQPNGIPVANVSAAWANGPCR